MSRPGRNNWIHRLQKAAAILYPRRCPICGAIPGEDAAAALLCPACLPVAAALVYQPPRLPATEHVFYALDGAASAFYYAEEIRRAILLCKLHGRPWIARELADLIAICLFGATPAGVPGGLPDYRAPGGLLPHDCIVPVPPGADGPIRLRMPDMLARRLGQILHLPVCRDLYPARSMQPQKNLTLAERLSNRKGGYALRTTRGVEGRRVLLVDDVITSGATVSACAMALMQGGAANVFAVSVAVDEQRTPNPGSARETAR